MLSQLSKPSVLDMEWENCDISILERANIPQFSKLDNIVTSIPAGNYMFKVNNRNTRTRCEICSKLTIKIPGIFIVKFENISYLAVLFLLLTLSR